ncbi:bifunctional nuclease domain-containing protein [Aquirufa sp.]|uniref:bifunctional nuclease domain-containing protein n=1 Tax=Aquirufa sp. TaxID=2676249 RepID=UPI0037C04AFC
MPAYHTLRINTIAPSSVAANSYVIVLQSIELSDLSFPIVIGNQEAQSISIFIEGISIKRPLTHDLIFQILLSTRIDLEFVEITSFKDGIFFAELHLINNNVNTVVDARPSDAIAIAVRFKKEIRINIDLLNSIGFNSNQEIKVDTEGLNTDIYQSKSKSELEKDLLLALTNENYEEAAFLRDQIEKLNSKK